MSENSKIEWTDHTFNPWIGCARISPGCDNCYAAVSTPARAMRIEWGAKVPRHRTAPSTWKDPIKWNARHAEFFAAHGRRQRVFCASLADVFDTDVDPAWRRDLFDLIELTPNLVWMLLTKRIGNAFREIARVRSHDWLMGRENVWIGATIVNRPEMLRDAEKLLAVPARVRFWSVEPMLGDLGEIPLRLMPDWVICGGESGRSARPMHPDWARALRDQCADAGVPFLFKQWGEWKPICQMDDAETQALYRSNRKARDHEDQGTLDDLYGRMCRVDQLCLHIDGAHAQIGSPNAFLAGTSPMQAFKVGKKAGGRLLDGRTHDEFPRGAA